MVATFSETSASTCRKFLVKQDINNLKLFKKYVLLWSPSPIFALE